MGKRSFLKTLWLAIAGAFTGLPKTNAVTAPDMPIPDVLNRPKLKVRSVLLFGNPVIVITTGSVFIGDNRRYEAEEYSRPLEQSDLSSAESISFYDGNFRAPEKRIWDGEIFIQCRQVFQESEVYHAIRKEIYD